MSTRSTRCFIELRKTTPDLPTYLFFQISSFTQGWRQMFSDDSWNGWKVPHVRLQRRPPGHLRETWVITLSLAFSASGHFQHTQNASNTTNGCSSCRPAQSSKQYRLSTIIIARWVPTNIPSVSGRQFKNSAWLVAILDRFILNQILMSNFVTKLSNHWLMSAHRAVITNNLSIFSLAKKKNKIENSFSLRIDTHSNHWS